jgi:nicotinate-nucleotide adenylyltransferase
VFGGTFDPVHVAHLVLAECVSEAVGAGEVLFVPASRPPHKAREALSDAADREAMVRLAIEGNGSFSLSRVELEREGRSYAIDTIREIARGWGCKPYYFMGADSLLDLPAWRDPDAILSEAEVLVAERPGVDAALAGGWCGRVRLVSAPLLDVSSTAIRERVRRGASIRYLVTEAVRAYILRRGLYRPAEGL